MATGTRLTIAARVLTAALHTNGGQEVGAGLVEIANILQQHKPWLASPDMAVFLFPWTLILTT